MTDLAAATGFDREQTIAHPLRLAPTPTFHLAVRTGRDILRRVSNVTHILDRAQSGDPKAAEELLPLVYGELRKLAAIRMAHEPAGQTLQATALVHEAWLRVMRTGNPQFKNETHFMAAAAEAMRRILIERARHKRSARGGGQAERVPLHESELAPDSSVEELLAVDEALDRLAGQAAMAADLVKLRYFVGMTMAEAATALGVPLRTAERLWAYAKAWLRREIGGGP